MNNRRMVLAGATLFLLIGCSAKSSNSDGSSNTNKGGSSSSSGGSSGGPVSSADCDCAVGAYIPVCGEDGQTYDAACGRQCVSADIACDGECPCDSGSGGSASGGSSSGGSSSGGSSSGGSSAGASSGVDCNCMLGAYFPVCGEDGNTYDATCGTECVNQPIDCLGECPCTDCNSLAFDYGEQLAQAKACDPSVDDVVCTATVTSALACGCPTSVNPDNMAAIAALEQIQKQWNGMGCGAAILCPAIACIAPESGLCEPLGDYGTCTDKNFAIQ